MSVNKFLCVTSAKTIIIIGMHLLSLRLIYEDLMKELRIHGKKENGANLVAYKSEVWIWQGGEIPEDIKLTMQQYFSIADEDIETINDLRDFLEGEKVPALLGSIHDNELWVGYTMQFDPKSSVLVKKVADQLKLKKVSYSASDDDEYSVSRKKMQGKVPDIVYHGTSTKYLSDISRFGLKPGVSPSNYPELVHWKDRIFFTSKFDEAKYHAEHTASRVGGQPMILELTIPDKNKLQADYDIAREYPQIATKMSRESGIWGYDGRIPASFIKWLYVVFDFSKNDPFKSKKDYKKMQFKKALQYDEMGYFDY